MLVIGDLNLQQKTLTVYWKLRSTTVFAKQSVRVIVVVKQVIGQVFRPVTSRLCTLLLSEVDEMQFSCSVLGIEKTESAKAQHVF